MKEAKNQLICDPHTGVCSIQSDEKSYPTPILPLKADKKIKVIYFTDPICSSCWGIEPQLRKLKLTYPHLIDIDYKMGGLLPNWNYNAGGISGPADVAKHWDEVSLHYQMPIDGDVWLEQSLDSSYPPSIAFKAAQAIDPDKAIAFLRYLREAVFLKKQNITLEITWLQAAQKANLDELKLKALIHSGQAEKAFQEDLTLAQQLGIRGFPSLLFLNQQQQQKMIYGAQDFTVLENSIKALVPQAKAQNYSKDLASLSAIFHSLCPKEYGVLANISLAQAQDELDQAYQQEKMHRYITKNGNWYAKK